MVIAEIGVNHDGSATRALDLVRTAANCGADAVKFQIFRATTLLHPSCALAEYQRSAGAADNPVDLLRKYELSSEEIARVVKAIRDLKMIPLATPFSPTDLDLVEKLRLPAVKIASPDLVNRPLVRAAVGARRPLLLSTGGASMDEIERTVAWLRADSIPFVLLHCISAYPAPAHQANLCWIEEIGHRFAAPVGYSDHTTSPLAGAMAAAAGACIVEKHLTYDTKARGPDHAASADPAAFERYVRLIREADALRGAPGKAVLEVEQDVRSVSRQSMALRRAWAAGEVIGEEDLTVQRPGAGISAAAFDEVVGRRVNRALPGGTMLQSDMLEPADAEMRAVA